MSVVIIARERYLQFLQTPRVPSNSKVSSRTSPDKILNKNPILLHPHNERQDSTEVALNFTEFLP